MTTVKLTIQDDAKAQTLLNMLKILDFVEIEAGGCPAEGLTEGVTNFWEAVGEEVLKEEWDQPENDHWDEFYQQQL